MSKIWATPPISYDVNDLQAQLLISEIQIDGTLAISLRATATCNSPTRALSNTTLLSPIFTFKRIGVKFQQVVPPQGFDWSNVPDASPDDFELELVSRNVPGQSLSSGWVGSTTFVLKANRAGYWHLIVSSSVTFDEKRSDMLIWQHFGGPTPAPALDVKFAMPSRDTAVR